VVFATLICYHKPYFGKSMPLQQHFPEISFSKSTENDAAIAISTLPPFAFVARSVNMREVK